MKTWGGRSWVEKRMWAMSFKRSGEWEALIITWWAIVVSFRRLWRMSWAWIWRRWGREVEVFRRERILVVVLLRWGSINGAICDLSSVCLFWRWEDECFVWRLVSSSSYRFVSATKTKKQKTKNKRR